MNTPNREVALIEVLSDYCAYNYPGHTEVSTITNNITNTVFPITQHSVKGSPYYTWWDDAADVWCHPLLTNKKTIMGQNISNHFPSFIGDTFIAVGGILSPCSYDWIFPYYLRGILSYQFFLLSHNLFSMKECSDEKTYLAKGGLTHVEVESILWLRTKQIMA